MNKSVMQTWVDFALAHGHTIFPCGKASKRPITPNGFKDASNSPNVVNTWWREHPDANPAIACGASGIAVLDIDNGLETPEEFEAWRVRNNIPATYAVRTGRRKSFGAQLYFAGVMSDTKWNLDGCSGEIKSAGGYVMAAGCIHPETGFQYEVISDLPLVELPDQIKAFAKKTPTAPRTSGKSRNKIPTGQRHAAMVSEAGHLWNAGYSEDSIFQALQLFIKDNCENAEEKSAAQIRQIAHSAATTFARNEPVTETQPDEDELPRFPQLPGTLADFADALCPSLPWEYKFMSAAVIIGEEYAGEIALENSTHLETRFYCALHGGPGSGKSASMKETWQRLVETGIVKDTSKTMSIDSGPAFVSKLTETPRLLLAPDELADLFDKSRKHGDGGNSLQGELLKLYEHHETQNITKQNKKLYGKENQKVENARVAVLGGVTPGKWDKLWIGTDGGADGLQSRYIITTTNAPEIPAIQVPTNQTALDDALARLRRQLHGDEFSKSFGGDDSNRLVVKMEPLVIQRLEDWKKSKQSDGRLADMVKRLLMILAITNDEPSVSLALLDYALAWGDYQHLIKQRLMQPDATGNVHYAEIKIREAFMRGGKRKDWGGMSERNCRVFVHGDRFPGGVEIHHRAFWSLVKAEELVEVGLNRAGRAVYMHETTVCERTVANRSEPLPNCCQ